MFVFLEMAITKEVQRLHGEGRGDVPLCATALVSVLSLCDAIRNRDFSGLV